MINVIEAIEAKLQDQKTDIVLLKHKNETLSRQLEAAEREKENLREQLDIAESEISKLRSGSSGRNNNDVNGQY